MVPVLVFNVFQQTALAKRVHQFILVNRLVLKEVFETVFKYTKL